MKPVFNYEEFSTRNLGFITREEQEKLQQACVFVCGTGGMGGAAVMALARAGVGRFILADIDQFELSNLNRQVFAFTDTVGEDKAKVTAETIARINPTAIVTVQDGTWTETIEDTMKAADVVINGADDLAAALLLYRTARRIGRPVIDAYASSLPSVFVTRPGDPTPEERLGYGTEDISWDALTAEDRDRAFEAEVTHVLVHSTAHKYIDMEAVGDVVSGDKSRMSFAPMVISTGMLMTYETVGLLLGKTSGTDHRGWFFNPYKPGVERPHPTPIAMVRGYFVKRIIARLKGSAS